MSLSHTWLWMVHFFGLGYTSHCAMFWAWQTQLAAPSSCSPCVGKSSSKRRSSDIISLLVSIYGSKDLFINEYRSLLADRLLHQFSFSPER